MREGDSGVCDQLVDILLISCQCHQESMSLTFWFQPNWGYVLVGGIQLTSSTWWGFQYLQISAKDMAQNIIYSPGGGTKSP